MAAPHKDKIDVLLVDHVELFYAEKPICAHFLFLLFLQKRALLGSLNNIHES